MSNKNRILFLFLPLILFLSVFFFGGIQDEYYRLYPVVISLFLLFALFFLKNDWTHIEERPQPKIILIFILILFFFLFLFIQIIPLPGFLLRIFGPISYQFTFSDLQKSGIDTSGLYFPISLGSRETLIFLVQSFSFLSVLYLGLCVLREPDVRRKMVWVLCIGFSVISWLGLLHSFSGSSKVLWLFDRGYTFFGPYLNRNHAGGAFTVISTLCLGYVTRFGKNSRNGVFIFLFCLLTLGIFFTESRSALIAFLVSFIFFYIVNESPEIRRKTSKTYILLGLGVTLLLAILWQSEIFSRFLIFTSGSSSKSLEYRADFYRIALEIFSQSYLLGIGYGAFAKVSQAFVGGRYWLHPEHVENEYLESLVCGGILISGIIFTFLSLLAFRVWKTLSSPKESTTRKAYGIALVAFCVHSLFVFHSPLPAHQILFAILLAGFIASRKLRILDDYRMRYVMSSIAVISLFLSIILLRPVEGIHPSFSNREYETSKESSSDHRAFAILVAEDLEKALAERPLNSTLRYRWAANLASLRNFEAAKEAYRSARRLYPFELENQLGALRAFERQGYDAFVVDEWHQILQSPMPLSPSLKIQILLKTLALADVSKSRPRMEDALARLENLNLEPWRLLLAKATLEEDPHASILEAWNKASSSFVSTQRFDFHWIALFHKRKDKLNITRLAQRILETREDLGVSLVRLSSLLLPQTPPLRMEWLIPGHTIGVTPINSASRAQLGEDIFVDPESGSIRFSIHPNSTSIDTLGLRISRRMELSPKALSLEIGVVSTSNPENAEIWIRSGSQVLKPKQTWKKVGQDKYILSIQSLGQLFENETAQNRKAPLLTALEFMPKTIRKGTYTIESIEVFLDSSASFR